MGLTYFYIKNKGNGGVVDFGNGADRTTLVAASQDPKRRDNQILEFDVSEDPPYFFIANRSTGKVIDAQAATSEEDLINYPRKATKDASNQLWILRPLDAADSYFFIESKARSGGRITVGEPPREGAPRPLKVGGRLQRPDDSELWSIVKAD